jgi:CHAT domain-containing protein/Tfp pilus assembly protein PilF
MLTAGQVPGVLAAHAAGSGDSVYLRDARRHPDEVRERIGALMARSLIAAPALRLDTARALASAYAAAWGDSIPSRSVAEFAAASAFERRARVRADTLRLAGNRVLEQRGAAPALALWHASVRTAASVRYQTGIAAALGNLGAGFYLAGDPDSATIYLERAAAAALSIRDYRTAANALGTLGSVAKDAGDLARASRLYTRASRLRKAVGDTRGIAADLNNVGMVAERSGDLAAATESYRRALAINRTYGRELPAATNLVNLGNVASLEGRYAEADTSYHEALATYRRLAATPDEALVAENLGILAMRRGDYPAAVRALQHALAMTRRAHAVLAPVLVNLAYALVATGEYGHARRVLSELQPSASLTGTSGAGSVVLARADLALEFGDYAGAERDYQRAATLFREIGDTPNAAAAIEGKGILDLLRGRGAEARTGFTTALGMHEADGDRRATALARVMVGRAALAERDPSAAREAYASALSELTALHDPVGQAAALEGLGTLALAARLPLSADSFFRLGLGQLRRHPYAPAAWRLHAGAGAAREALGDRSAAVSAYELAAAEIESTASGFNPGERRSAYLEDKWDVYARLASVQRWSRPADAFATSERMRLRERRLAAGDERVLALAGDPALMTRARDLSQRIEELTRRIDLETASPGPERERAAGGGAALREQLAAEQQAYAQLLADAGEVIRGATRVSTAPADWHAVAATLRPEQIMLEYLVHDSTTLLFAITRDRLVAFDLGTSQRELAHLVDFAREMMLHSRGGEASWLPPLVRLHELLIRPVAAAGLLQGKRALVIVPHAELHFLPFQALVTDRASRRFLIESYVISYAPSAAAWAVAVPRPGFRSVLALAPRVAELPATRREVTTIGRRLHNGGVTVLVGGDATEAQLRRLASSYSIIHLATYGVLNRRHPLFSYIDLAPGGGEDGRLEAREIPALRLSGSLIVLSACETSLASGALRDVPPGEDWVGLVSSLLAAGAGDVLASAWPVQDAATADLMDRFYRALHEGAAPAFALAAAQREMIRENRLASPARWAAFLLIAAGRETT